MAVRVEHRTVRINNAALSSVSGEALANSLIELEGVSRTFRDGGQTRVEALRNVSLTIDEGEFVCLGGPSGAGKSTLMQLLGCLDRPDSGSYRFSGREVWKLGADGLAWLRCRAFGFVFQNYSLLESATAQENVELPGVYAGLGRTQRKKRALALLEKVGLSNRATHLPAELSGGEQQRVAIARSLMNGGRVILADEPTGALDRAGGEEVLKTLEGLVAEGHTVIIVSHSAEIAARARRRIELRDGRVTSDSGPAPMDKTAPRGETDPTGGTEPRGGDAAGTRASGFGIRAALASGLGMLRAGFRRKGRLRTFLTMAGAALAVWWVATLMSVVEGFIQVGEEHVVRSAAADEITLIPSKLTPDGIRRTSLTLDDANAIAESIPNVRATSPLRSEEMTAQSGGRNMEVRVRAYLVHNQQEASADLSLTLKEGGLLTPADEEQNRAVALIGLEVRRQLFPEPADPVGQHVAVNNLPLRVKGVVSSDYLSGMIINAAPGALEEWRTLEESSIYVPYSTGAMQLFGSEEPESITVWLRDSELATDTAQALGDLLIRRHGNDNFTLVYRAQAAREISRTRLLSAAVVLGIGAIALVASGFGVMAVMLMSVTARTREIGLRMAMGARRGDIRKQFLLEAGVMMACGGLAGALATLATVPIVASLGPGFPVSVSPAWLLGMLAGATAAGMLFGLAAARRAANLNPAEALADA